MDDKEANIVGLLNMTTRIGQKVLPEVLPEIDQGALAQQLRERVGQLREVQATQVAVIADRFTAQEVEGILEWAESPFGLRVLETIPLVSYYPFRDAVDELVATFTARIHELEERIRELEGGERSGRPVQAPPQGTKGSSRDKVPHPALSRTEP